MGLHIKYKTLFENYGLTTNLRIAHFMAQIEHESNLKPVVENLNYSEQGLLKIFPKYFNATQAKQYARKPMQIANRVYANRMGNGTEQSGDGWKYRGRGFIQITGKSNYTSLSNDVKIDFVANPDLLLNEANSMISALWFWSKNGLNELADKDDINGATRRINGGLNGLDHRKQLLVKWKSNLMR